MADSCTWRKVYQHNASGVGVAGSLTDLVRAIKGGADVQIRYYRSSALREFINVEWHRTCLHVSIANASASTSTDSIVSCTIIDIPDTNIDFTGRTFSNPFAVEWQIFSTTGKRQHVTFDYVTRQVQSDEPDNIGIAWYIRGYDDDAWWRQLLRNFADIRIRGSIGGGG